ncbi:MAG: glycerophosphodiester phosphodiesterase [Trueperaceae bacterium]|nr:glycerophosphodiester phosphodiesterase [Trueperaceae bacterium]
MSFAAMLLTTVVLVAWWFGPGWRPRPLPGVHRPRPWTFGHRGARGPAPENTMAAFDLAFAHLDGLETDVQRTADGHLVLFHDLELDGRPIRKWRFAALRTARPDLVTLETLLRAARDARGSVLNLEVKSDPRTLRGVLRSWALERDLVQAVRASGVDDRVLISSFDPFALARVRLLAPEVRTAFLTAPEVPMMLRGVPWARLLHVDAVHPEARSATPGLVARAHARGLPVHVWTVNDANDVVRLLRSGVDGVMGDDPEALRRAAQEA